MAHVLIIHEVDDYDAWKQIFDGAAELRRRAGELSFQVLRDVHAPGRVVHFSVWSSVAAAQAFFESPEVARIRDEAGVHRPEFVYLDQVASGTL